MPFSDSSWAGQLVFEILHRQDIIVGSGWQKPIDCNSSDRLRMTEWHGKFKFRETNMPWDPLSSDFVRQFLVGRAPSVGIADVFSATGEVYSASTGEFPSQAGQAAGSRWRRHILTSSSDPSQVRQASRGRMTRKEEGLPICRNAGQWTGWQDSYYPKISFSSSWADPRRSAREGSENEISIYQTVCRTGKMVSLKMINPKLSLEYFRKLWYNMPVKGRISRVFPFRK